MAGIDALIALRGAPNFRDLGGLRAQHGRRVRYGAVFRSGHLGALHAEDVAMLEQRLGKGVCVVDLRGADERQRAACKLPGATVHSLPIEPRVAVQLLSLAQDGEPLTPGLAQRLMCEAYEDFVRHTGPLLGAFLGHLTERAGKPLVVHCAAGKDRTGFMVAMLLGALGVARADIMDDYLQTNARMQPRASSRFTLEIMEVLGTVREEFLNAALAVVDREFGGLDAYLGQAAGLTRERRAQLRDGLLV